MSVVFKFSTPDISFELDGPEGFVRPHLEFLAPFVRRVTGAPPGPVAAAGPVPPGLEGVGSWWMAHVPPGLDPSLQDTILLFAYFMRSYRKMVFLSEDIRRCFQVMGIDEPKSLLQILGTLKREHGLLLNAGRRGEYMMNTTGIARVRDLLGEAPRAGGSFAAGGGADPSGPDPSGRTDSRNLFKD